MESLGKCCRMSDRAQEPRAGLMDCKADVRKDDMSPKKGLQKFTMFIYHIGNSIV